MLESGPATQLTRPQRPHRRIRRPQPEAKKSEFLFGPAIIDVQGKGRVLVVSFGSVTSGLPPEWAATQDRPGVNLLEALGDDTVGQIAARVEGIRKSADLVVASMHWGGNWGYGISPVQQRLARRLVDEAGVDVVHGHSSHHPRGIEVYPGRPILYGCGDFLNDYEGIGGYEEFRNDLALAYFVSMDPTTGRLARLAMSPFQIRRFRCRRASRENAEWLRDTLGREGRPLGTQVELNDDGTLSLQWKASAVNSGWGPRRRAWTDT